MHEYNALSSYQLCPHLNFSSATVCYIPIIPSLDTYWLPAAPQPGFGLCEPFPIHWGLLPSVILRSLCAATIRVESSWVQHCYQVQKTFFFRAVLSELRLYKLSTPSSMSLGYSDYVIGIPLGNEHSIVLYSLNFTNCRTLWKSLHPMQRETSLMSETLI